MKQKTINIKNIYHCEAEGSDSGNFTLIFLNDKYKVQLHFDRWWIVLIVRMLWKIIKREEKEIERLRDSMGE